MIATRKVAGIFALLIGRTLELSTGFCGALIKP